MQGKVEEELYKVAGIEHKRYGEPIQARAYSIGKGVSIDC